MKLKEPKPASPPAQTQDGRMSQLTNSALNLIETQIADGSVSSSVLVQLLKTQQAEYQYKIAKLQSDINLQSAKERDMANGNNSAQLYEQAIRAFGVYTGERPIEDLDISEGNDGQDIQ